MPYPLARAVPLALFAALSLAACGGGMRFQAINMESSGNDLGLPPPVAEDYRPCYAGHAEGLDTTGDGRPDYVRVKDDSGRDVCHGSDSDHDGKIDQWDVMNDKGQLAKRARDTNADGRADEHWSFDAATQCATVFHDRDGDGKADAPAIDTCQPLDTTTAPKASTPTPPPAGTGAGG